MATTNIIELRQADSNNVIKNGDYETLLAGEITLSNGDILLLKNAFIDTKPEGNIIIENDTTLTIQYMPYINDWLKTADKENYVLNNNDPTVIDGANCLDFVPYYYTEGEPLLNFEKVVSVNFKTLMPEPHPNSIQTTYSYVNIANQTIIFHTEILASNLPPEYGYYKDMLPNIIAKIGSFKILTASSTLDSLGLSYDNPATTVIPNVVQNIYNPFIFEASVIVPAGNYSPTYLSLFISEKLTQNSSTNGINYPGICKSAFLRTSGDFDTGKNYPNGVVDETGAPLVIPSQTKFIATDASLMFNFVADKQYYIGSSQIALEYDSDSNKFVFQFLHFPMYDDTAGTNISVRYQYYDNNPAEAIVSSAKNGGIFLTGLLSTDINGPTTLWSDVFGFNLAQICVNPHAGYVTDILGIPDFIQTLGPIQHGVNATTGFVGIDSVVIKAKDKWYSEPVLSSEPDNLVCSTINNTVALEASYSIDQLLNKYSHYILQVDFTLSNNFIGTEIYRNINGIVSRYYSDNNYTFGDQAGAIQYQHFGNSTTLRSARVRILSSDKTIDPDLGPDNTLFFEIVKQPAQLKKA